MAGIHGPCRVALAASVIAVCAPGARAAESLMVRCGRDYQAAKSAGTLNGADWAAYRLACAGRLGAAPAEAAPAMPVPTAASAPRPAAAPPAEAVGAAPGTGAAAMHARQKRCGAEWTAQKASLVAATPGLTWPKYWSQCNSRLKGADR